MTKLKGALARKVRWWAATTPVVFGPAARVHLSPGAQVMNAVLNVHSGTITVEDHVFFGHGVMLLTGTHRHSIRGPGRAIAIPSTDHDIVIEEGAWLASGATIIGPCRVGRDAVVAAGAVVTKDVAAGEIVGGVPAVHLGCVPPHPPLTEADAEQAQDYERYKRLLAATYAPRSAALRGPLVLATLTATGRSRACMNSHLGRSKSRNRTRTS